MMRISPLVVALWFACVASARAQDIEPDDVKPGIAATYSDSKVEVVRLESAVALDLPAAQSAHPAIDPSLYRVRWEGTINILRNGSYRFGSSLLGKAKLSIGGKPVFDMKSAESKPELNPPVDLKSGIHTIAVEFVPAGWPARFELLWQTPLSRVEPIPASVLGHQPKALPAAAAASFRAEYGRFLFEEMACFKCHAAGKNDLRAAGVPDRAGPNLTEIATRTNADWLGRWLADPSALRPSTAMPKMFADDAAGKAELRSVQTYLMTLGKAPVNRDRPVKLDAFAKSVSTGKALFTSVGCAACHREADTKGIAEVSVHGFGGLASPRWAYPLGDLAAKFEEKPLAAYIEKPHATHPHGRMPSLNLSAAESLDIARFLIQSTAKSHAATPQDAESPDAVLAERTIVDAKEKELYAKAAPGKRWQMIGQKLIVAKGCVNCHAVEPAGKPLAAAPFAALDTIRAKADAGCASPQHAKGPRYKLDDKQRSALAAFFQSNQAWPGTKADAYQTQIAFKRFACLNCHERDGEGGISNQLAEAMKKAERGRAEDDVLPPTLTGVGHKLRTSYLTKVLLEGARSRPWMGLRMPQFGADNVGHLAEGLSRVEGTEPDNAVHTVPATRELLEAGRLMIGKGGLGCIGCHDIAGIPNTGTRGPDLATTNERVRYDWYRRWLEQPQRMAPNTRMPQIFVDGKSPLPKLLGGDSDKQADAMWAYLALGPTMPLPAGLEPPKGLTIAVDARPEILRTFMPELGSRGIAVGYPGHMNMAFDAATCRLVYAWSGNFLDAGPVWGSRGGAPAKLLGNKVWNAPAVNPWASTASAEPPDFAARAGDPAYGAKVPDLKRYDGEPRVHFDGYSLDEKGQPTFRYRIKGDSTEPLQIAEKPQPLTSAVMNGLQRNYTVQAPEGQQTWLLVGTSKKPPKLIDANDRVSELADGKSLPADATIAMPGDGDRATVYQAVGLSCMGQWVVSKSADGYELLLKLAADPKKKESVGVRIWLAPKLDATNLGAIREAK